MRLFMGVLGILLFFAVIRAGDPIHQMERRTASNIARQEQILAQALANQNQPAPAAPVASQPQAPEMLPITTRPLPTNEEIFGQWRTQRITEITNESHVGLSDGSNGVTFDVRTETGLEFFVNPHGKATPLSSSDGYPAGWAATGKCILHEWGTNLAGKEEHAFTMIDC